MTTNHTKSNQKQPEVSIFCNLTEQWKKGELEQGYYYTKYNPKVGEPFIEIELRNYLLDLAKVRDADTVEVLAPVPSYEQWQTVFNCANKYEVEYIECANDYENVKKENQQIKELLKEWIEHLKDTKCDRCQNLIRRTDNAIGEKK